MAKREVFVCDICGNQRADANHWFVGILHGSEDGIPAAYFFPWGRHQDGAHVSHLCGQACAHKLLDQFMSGELK